MSIQTIFKSSLPSFKYFFKNGVAANFINGRFVTDNKTLEDELMGEVGEVGRTKSNHTFIFVDEAEPTLDTEALSPLELIKLQAKEEARAELLAEIAAQQARAMNAQENVSSSQSNHAASVNNSAILNASLSGVATFQPATAATPATPEATPQAATAAGVDKRLAGLAAFKKV